MDTESNDASKMRDQELNESLEAHGQDDLDGLSMRNQRLARVQEYEEAAIARPDPFAAVIGIGNADFQRVFEHLGAAILDELDSRTPTVDAFRELGPEIRLLVKIRNSIETDLAVHTADAGRPATAFPPTRPAKGITNGPVRDRALVPKRWIEND